MLTCLAKHEEAISTIFQPHIKTSLGLHPRMPNQKVESKCSGKALCLALRQTKFARRASKAVAECVATGAEDYPNTWDSFRAFNMLLGLESHVVRCQCLRTRCYRRCHNDEEDFLVCHRRMLYDLETSLQKMLGCNSDDGILSVFCS